MENYYETNTNESKQNKQDNEQGFKLDQKTLITSLIVFIILVGASTGLFYYLKNKNKKSVYTGTVATDISLLPTPEKAASKAVVKDANGDNKINSKSKNESSNNAEKKKTEKINNNPQATAEANGDKTSTSVFIGANSSSASSAAASGSENSNYYVSTNAFSGSASASAFVNTN